MAKVIQWFQKEMTCVICNHHWIAQYPETAVTLECPQCGYENGV